MHAATPPRADTDAGACGYRPRVLVAISGGAGFLGLHLGRRLLADGHTVRTLDLAPLDDPSSSAASRSFAATSAMLRRPRGSSTGADVLVHTAAALPIQMSGEAIRSVNVDGTATMLAAAREAGVRRRGRHLVDGRVRRA